MFVGMTIENYSEGMVEKAGMFDERMEILKMFNHQTMRLFPEATTELKRGVRTSARSVSTKLLGLSCRRWGVANARSAFDFLWPALPHTNFDTRMGALITVISRIICVPNTSHSSHEYSKEG